MATISAEWGRAIRKAQAVGGPAAVVRVWRGEYLVASATAGGVVYVVRGEAPDGSDHACTCPAGLHGRVCWHVASVRLRRVQETALRQYRRLRRRRDDREGQGATAATVAPALPRAA